METHHPHIHKGPEKNFWHYFFEFFMLFLAVFCGFLAENFREHQVEKNRGKQYIESFYHDLVSDTARVTYCTDYDDLKLNVLEHLSDCYDELSKNPDSTSCLLDILNVTLFNRPFKITERTLNQLANAGGYRLLPNEDADSIIAYQKHFNNIQEFQETAFQEAQNNLRHTFNLLVNYKANAQMFKPNGRFISTSFDKNNITSPVLFSKDKVLLNTYFNELTFYYRVTVNHKGVLSNLKDRQLRLIEFFKKKYSLD